MWSKIRNLFHFSPLRWEFPPQITTHSYFICNDFLTQYEICNFLAIYQNSLQIGALHKNPLFHWADWHHERVNRKGFAEVPAAAPDGVDQYGSMAQNLLYRPLFFPKRGRFRGLIQVNARPLKVPLFCHKMRTLRRTANKKAPGASNSRDRQVFYI